MDEKIFPKIEETSQNVNKITFEDGKVLHLVGTAHISKESVELVEKTIEEVQPDTVAVELDPQRLEVLKNRKKYENTDIIEIFKSGKAFFFAAQLMLTAYQKKMAKKTGVMPGAEFKRAVEMGEERGINLVTADRNITVTLKRAFRSMGFIEKAKIFGSLLFAEDSDIDAEKIEELKQGDTLSELIGEMGDSAPSLKRVILDERDTYLCGKIKNGLGDKTVAVVGAAHVPGILKQIKDDISEKSLSRIEVIPPASTLSRALPWLIPAIIAALVIYGFMTGNQEVTGQAAIYWVLINGILSALGCLAAFGHPLTIISGFFAAPITSLNPAVGAGMVTGLVQLFLVRPKVSDMEMAAEDASTIKGWWSNRLNRTLLVSVFASLGSAIGTFIAVPIVTNMLLS
jgi:pheromone shutdown-related protein TraB